MALARWPLVKLANDLAGVEIVLCAEALRRTLLAAGLSHQRTRWWKGSADPDVAENAERVDRHSPRTASSSASTRCDRSSRLRVTVRAGRPSGDASACVRRTSNRGGVRYLFGAYEVHADRLHGRLRAHKTPVRCFAFDRQMRMR